MEDMGEKFNLEGKKIPKRAKYIKPKVSLKGIFVSKRCKIARNVGLVHALT